MAKSVQETSPDGPCVAKARAFHTHTRTLAQARSVSVTGLGGGSTRWGNFQISLEIYNKQAVPGTRTVLRRSTGSATLSGSSSVFRSDPSLRESGPHRGPWWDNCRPCPRGSCRQVLDGGVLFNPVLRAHREFPLRSPWKSLQDFPKISPWLQRHAPKTREPRENQRERADRSGPTARLHPDRIPSPPLRSLGEPIAPTA